MLKERSLKKGEVTATYAIILLSAQSCRLLLKGYVSYPKNFWGWLLRIILPWADLLMMIKQFQRLKYLAENQETNTAPKAV